MFSLRSIGCYLFHGSLSGSGGGGGGAYLASLLSDEFTCRLEIQV